jgi:hypothetical protein
VKGWRLQAPLTRVRPGERVVRVQAGETVLTDGELGRVEDVMIRAVVAGVLAYRDGWPPDGGHPAPAPRHLTAVPK